MADRAYASDGPRETLAKRGAMVNLRLTPTRERFPSFNPTLYRRIIHV